MARDARLEIHRGLAATESTAIDENERNSIGKSDSSPRRQCTLPRIWWSDGDCADGKNYLLLSRAMTQMFVYNC
jgi:hypothetical protein